MLALTVYDVIHSPDLSIAFKDVLIPYPELFRKLFRDINMGTCLNVPDLITKLSEILDLSLLDEDRAAEFFDSSIVLFECIQDSLMLLFMCLILRQTYDSVRSKIVKVLLDSVLYFAQFCDLSLELLQICANVLSEIFKLF